MSWQREDAVYAAAAAVAAALVLYFTIGNFGLVPTPLAPGRAEAAHSIGVPSLGSIQAAAAPTPGVPTTVPQFPSTPGRGPAAAPPTRRPAPAADRTAPGAAISTSEGTQVTLTQPATVDGTASDAGSGIGAVTVTFAPNSGGTPIVVPARLACDAARKRCSWSADVPSIAGQYRVTASVTDRASNTARAGPVAITVVNGGGAVKPVTDVADGLLGGAGRAVGGLLGAGAL